jgi:hypothetical protein
MSISAISAIPSTGYYIPVQPVAPVQARPMQASGGDNDGDKDGSGGAAVQPQASPGTGTRLDIRV